ncbi:unnamed protein product, partial [Prunus brigantina]
MKEKEKADVAKKENVKAIANAMEKETQANLNKQDAAIKEKEKVVVAMEKKVKAVADAMEKKETVSNLCLDRLGENKVFLQRPTPRSKIDLGFDNAFSKKQENLYKQDATMEEKEKATAAMEENVKAVAKAIKKKKAENVKVVADAMEKKEKAVVADMENDKEKVVAPDMEK